MPAPSRPTQGKRIRERARLERMQEKEQQRALRKEAKAERAANKQEGVDPDLIGIFPGPQPRSED